MDNKNKERFMYILGGFVVGISAAVVILLLFYPVPMENKDIVNIALGTLLGMAVTVVSFFFGSSKSSADKTQIIAKQANGTTPPAS